MKRKVVIMLMCCLAITYSAEAQFFKKLKKKAENAVERTIMNRTDEEVSKGTDNAIDSITKGGKGKKNKKDAPKNIGETEKNIDSTKQQNKAKEAAMQKKMAGLFGGSDLKGVPEVYEFSYKATMKISSQKDETEIQYWMEPGQPYFGNWHKEGTMNSITVMDMENQAMVMFTDDGKQKMAMKIPAGKKTIEKLTKKMEEKNKQAAEDIKVVPIAGKTILGYHCEGYQITSKDGISKVWVTNETPVGYLGGIANTEGLPSSVLPIGENTMFMEMQFESAKKKKDNFSMVCTELKEESMSIIKAEYSTMGGF
ncbi:DUF4412 domain-containing protein [Muricauda ruestringensis]|uniref:DUF4412 domain-containing protein n=1 Tax=Flagellimonas aurea TaxID=2915619 RepID=A0ABS3G7U2_9FLAO|nr:DUF4412 domain-containing protein [Allomuricauda aurea]MAO18041.1 hypothetical protein [Allomuricauda sp.]MBO0355485.1 DUF4412 domain-containing protein [Allomuricauda aurea]|tara:strand:+ start:228 stop:1160 length:933 start_codon:yes stop_codon:yes gene_type:complete